VVTHQLQVERGTGKVRQSKTDVLPLYNATQPTSVLHLKFSCKHKLEDLLQLASTMPSPPRRRAVTLTLNF